MFRMACFVFACVGRSVSGRKGLEAPGRENGREGGAVKSLKEEEMLS